MYKILLANIIRIIHILLVLFIVIAPYTEIIPLLVLNITLCLSLLFHWYCTSDICCLTLFESKLRGVHYKETFLHEFIGPVYNVSETNLSLISYIVVIFSMITSIYKLYTNSDFNEYLKKYKNGDIDFSKFLFYIFTINGTV